MGFIPGDLGPREAKKEGVMKPSIYHRIPQPCFSPLSMEACLLGSLL